MPGSNVAAVPLTTVKRKHKKDDEEDEDDSGSDVVRTLAAFDF
jgi:hypothetical protein